MVEENNVVPELIPEIVDIGEDKSVVETVERAKANERKITRLENQLAKVNGELQTLKDEREAEKENDFNKMPDDPPVIADESLNETGADDIHFLCGKWDDGHVKVNAGAVHYSTYYNETPGPGQGDGVAEFDEEYTLPDAPYITVESSEPYIHVIVRFTTSSSAALVSIGASSSRQHGWSAVPDSQGFIYYHALAKAVYEKDKFKYVDVEWNGGDIHVPMLAPCEAHPVVFCDPCVDQNVSDWDPADESDGDWDITDNNNGEYYNTVGVFIRVIEGEDAKGNTIVVDRRLIEYRRQVTIANGCKTVHKLEREDRGTVCCPSTSTT